VRIEPLNREMVMAKEYAAEFRRRAVALARSGRPVGQLAADLKVSEATLFRWVAQDQVDREERPGLPTVERVELVLYARRTL
jgi:transposase-like protein